MQDIILHKSTGLVYQEKERTKETKFFLKPTHLILKDVNTTLYRGEVLGILGEYSTLKYLKNVFAGHLKPDLGRVKYDVSFLSLDVEDHILNKKPLHIFVVEILEEFMTEKDVKVSLDILKRHPIFFNYWEKSVDQLSRQDIAVVLLEISSEIQADITLYNNFFRYLNDDGFNRLKSIINTLEEKEHGVFLLESKFEPIEKLANHFVWLSYGQMRFEGTVQKGRQVYNDYMKKRSQIRSVDEEALFDLEWKERMYEPSNFKHGLKRRNRKSESFIDELNIQQLIIAFVVFFTMLLSYLLVIMDFEFTKEEHPFVEVAEDTEEDVQVERLRYGFVLKDDLKLQDQTLPKYALIQVTETEKNKLNVRIGSNEETVSNDDVLLFNPSSMFETIDYDAMLQYMSDDYLDNHLFYANYLNQPVDNIESDFTLSDINDYKATVDNTDITFLIDKGTVIGIITSGSSEKEIKKAFNIEEDYKIYKTDGGFVLYDAPNNTWVYVSR